MFAQPILKCGIICVVCSIWSTVTSKYHFWYIADPSTLPTKMFGLTLETEDVQVSSSLLKPSVANFMFNCKNYTQNLFILHYTLLTLLINSIFNAVRFWHSPCNMVYELCLQQQILAWQQEVTNIILWTSDCNTITNTKGAEDIKDFGVSSMLLQQRDNDFNVLILQ